MTQQTTVEGLQAAHGAVLRCLEALVEYRSYVWPCWSRILGDIGPSIPGCWIPEEPEDTGAFEIGLKELGRGRAKLYKAVLECEAIDSVVWPSFAGRSDPSVQWSFLPGFAPTWHEAVFKFGRCVAEAGWDSTIMSNVLLVLENPDVSAEDFAREYRHDLDLWHELWDVYTDAWESQLQNELRGSLATRAGGTVPEFPGDPLRISRGPWTLDFAGGTLQHHERSLSLTHQQLVYVAAFILEREPGMGDLQRSVAFLKSKLEPTTRAASTGQRSNLTDVEKTVRRNVNAFAQRSGWIGFHITKSQGGTRSLVPPNPTPSA